ncbi:hypothetical protein LTR49_026495 [Elasticomyces elasticus]|nr:hypothetical protein LTR49_026495 [Elasticomyces elasticus]
MASSGRKPPHAPPTSAQSDGLATATTHVRTVDTQKKSVKINTANANEYLLYLRDYGVLICRVYGFAVRQLENHLRIAHQGSAKDRREIVGMFKHYECMGADFLQRCGSPRYFTVDQEEQHSPTDKGETPAAASIRASDGRFADIIGKWDHDLDKHQKGLELADAETAKTDHTLWFKRNGWPEHVAKCNLQHLSRISRLPDQEERLLQRVVELNTTLIDGACCSHYSTGRPDGGCGAQSCPSRIRPLARLQNASSQQKYATYMARFVCYSLRVLQSCAYRGRVRETEHSNDDSSDDDVSGNDSSYSDEGNNGDDSSAGHANHAVRTSVDVYKDARRQCPWHARQRELLGRVQRSIEGGWEDQVQLKALLDW